MAISVLDLAAAGRAAWPAIAVADAALAAAVAERLADAEPAHAAEAFLATALAAGDPAAVAVFEAELVPEIDVALRRMRLPGGTADEVRQALRVELLVGTAGGGPRIADYGGRGALAGWLRVTATRRALKVLRAAKREESLDELLLDHWPLDRTPDATPSHGRGAAASPEGRHLRATYTTELKRAVGEAFAALAVRQRNLLRQHLLDDLTIDELARLYRVHRATCARWLVDAREELGKRTRKHLGEHLGLAGDELASLLRYLDSDLELSLSRLLRPPER